jgi:tetratricopeptide (TPR) repeat protein
VLSDSGISTSAEEVLARAEDAALRATSLDASLPEAYYVLGAVRMAEGDFIAAEDHLTRASALDPSWTLALEALVRLHLWAGRPGPAVAVAQRAVELDPLSPSAHAELARALAADGRCHESLARLERIATLDPPLLRAGPMAAQCHALAGRWSEALAALDRPGAEGDPFAMAHRAYVLARSGRRDEALRLLDTLLESWRNGGRVAFPVAIVHAGLEDPDETFRWLHRALDDGLLPILPGTSIMDPLFQELHPDPRFEELRARLGSQNR